MECAPARNACRGEGLNEMHVDGDAPWRRCLIKDVVKTAERAARRREQPREVECVKTVTEPLPSVADLRKAFYDADVDGHGCLPADRVQRRWRDLCGSAADPALIQKASRAGRLSFHSRGRHRINSGAGPRRRRRRVRHVGSGKLGAPAYFKGRRLFRGVLLRTGTGA